MVYRKWFTVLSLFVIAALILSACQPLQLPEVQSVPALPAAEQSIPATLAEPHGLRPDAPEYAKHGPFAVGYKPLVIGEGTDHPLDAGLWYPALNPDGVKEEVTYAMTLKIPMEQPNTPAVVYGHALLDARVDVAAASYPLVVFSHGFSTNAAWYSTIIEHYASYGFIVLAPEHVEHFDPEWSELWSASIDRPRDIKQTLDYAEQMTASSGEMAGLIDMQHVAVVGHSYGGYTALSMAGAQYDLAAYNARCAQLPPDDPNTFLCAPLVPKKAEMAARAGLDPMPEGLWPSFGDPRVTAIVPMAGDAYLFDKAGLSKITVPMMAIGGTADTGTPYEWGSKPSYDNASSAKKALVTLQGAEHTITSSCEGMPWISETPFYQWICFDPVWDKDRGLDLINHFSTAFLLAELKGDAEAATALAAENVSFPGIQYETTGYTATSEAMPPVASPAPFVALSEVEFTSEALADNLLGDPATRKFAIYLPPSYATGEGRYPVVYALHGFTGNQWGMLGFQEKMDAMIQNGDVPEMIVVMPDASNVFKGSFYMNSPTIGDYATYITSDLVEWVDTHYRTIPQQEARGITGCSMGGLGAVRLGLQFPQVFGVVAGVSGPYLQAYHRMLDRAAAQITSVPETFEEMAAQPFEVQAIFALAAAAAPNADNPPFYLDVPFANLDGAVQPVQSVIDQFSVVYAGAAVDGYQERTAQPQEILLYHGDQDPMAGVEGARLLSSMLTEEGVDHEYLEVAGGGHCNLNYEAVVRFMAEHLFFGLD